MHNSNKIKMYPLIPLSGYTHGNAFWNKDIPPGNSVEFGMLGAKSVKNAPAPVVLVTGDVCVASTPADSAQ